MAKPVDSEIQRARISFLELIKSPSPSIYSWLAQIILTSLNEKIENYDVGESLLDEKLTGKISTELFGIHELIMNGFRTEALFLLDDIAVDKKNIDLAMQMAFFYDALNQPLDGHQKLIRCDPSLSKILSKKIPKVFNALSYPRPFRKEVAFALTKVDIPEEVVFAVMRQESGFIKEARSFAQAKGLMQLVYSSALAESKSWKLDKLDENDLYLPHINVLLGTSILHKYWQRFGNLMVGLAAYNAGPTPAKSWILKNKNAPIDTFIDTVPYKETREYLKSVGNAIFRYHDGAMSLPDIRIFSEKNLQ